MDTKLFEALLQELLQLPKAHRTAEKILASLTLAATAAGVSLTQGAAPLQIEHMQLSAALDRLALQLGSHYRARAMLRLGGGLEGINLGAALEPEDRASTDPRYIAFGATAREVLSNLTRDIQRQTPAEPAQARRRTSGQLSLNRLAQQLSATA